MNSGRETKSFINSNAKNVLCILSKGKITQQNNQCLPNALYKLSAQ